MSAFICSDKHFAVVARYMFNNDIANAQRFANDMKRENIKSVNHRYNESTRFKAVNLFTVTPEEVAKGYDGNDVLRLLQCIDYQSSEHDNYNDYPIKLAMLALESQGCNANNSLLWSI